MTYRQAGGFGQQGYSGNNAGGFRDPLDLGEVMSHYQIWLDGAAHPSQGVLPTSMDDPYQMGSGPRTCSTDTSLALCPQICWDVQRYYRIMGVDWKATKKQLMLAYQKFGPMPSARQTYVFKQLLDPKIRREYDNWPLGVPFLYDEDVQMWLKKKAMEVAKRRSQQMGVDVEAEEVLSEWGMKVTPDEVVDSDAEQGQDALEAEPAKSPARVTPWLYAWFAWRTSKADTEVLRRWQELLISVLSDLGERVQLAVGFAGRTESRYVIGAVHGTTVVFLNDKHDPTPEIAAAAAQALLNDLQQT